MAKCNKCNKEVGCSCGLKEGLCASCRKPKAVIPPVETKIVDVPK